MPAWMSWGAVVAMFTVGAQFVLFLRWLHRRMRDDEIMRVCVRDIATNHLPLLYAELHRISDHLGIEFLEAPRIEFVDFQQNGRKRHAH